MLIAAVAMATMLAWAPEDEPAELVSRLGSPRFADREAAAEALKRLGSRALPELRKARSAADREIRVRAAKVRDEIESLALLEPTMVRLDFRDRPLAEVVAEFGRRAGVAVTSDTSPWIARRSQDQSKWPDRRVTLDAHGPLPFWEAVDRLCRAGGLRRTYPRAAFGPDEPFDQLLLVPGEASPPRSDSGPFRVEFLGIRRERDLDLTPGLARFGMMRPMDGPPARVVRPANGPGVKDVRTSSFFAELLISAEPRLRIVGEPSLERLIAVDSQGHSVLREPTAQERQAEAAMFRSNPQLDPVLHPEVRFGAGGRRSAPTQMRFIALDDATPPGGRLAELKGVVVVAVMGRRPDPLVVPLAGASGKTFAVDGVRVTVHEADVKPSQYNGELELSLETDRPAETLRVLGPGIGPLELSRPIDLIEREVEILDDQGRSFDWSFLRPPPGGLRGRMRLQVRARDTNERIDFSGLRLRVSAMVGAAVEVPFSFTDIPMP